MGAELEQSLSKRGPLSFRPLTCDDSNGSTMILLHATLERGKHIHNRHRPSIQIRDVSEAEVEFDGEVIDLIAVVEGVQELRDALGIRRDIRTSSWLHNNGGLPDLFE